MQWLYLELMLLDGIEVVLQLHANLVVDKPFLLIEMLELPHLFLKGFNFISCVSELN